MTEKVKLCHQCERLNGKWRADLMTREHEDAVKFFEALERRGVLILCSECRRSFEELHGLDVCDFYCVSDKLPKPSGGTRMNDNSQSKSNVI